MTVLITAVVLVGMLCALDLLLTLGVIRRLREHTSMLAKARDLVPGVIGLEPGQSPAPFSAMTTAGDIVRDPAGLRVVAFFSSSCSACPERVPPFVTYLTEHAVERDSVLAIIESSGDEPPPYLPQLAGAARVCVEEPDGEVARAFRVTGFPAFCVLGEDGSLVTSGYEVSALSVAAPV